MMLYAVVQSGTVKDIVVWDGRAKWKPPEGCSATALGENSQGVAAGWLYVGGEFTAPQEPESPLPGLDAYRVASQNVIESTAQSRRYESSVTCASYVNSTVEAWAAEAKAFVAWRDAVWAHAYARLAEVEAGAPQPSIKAFIETLPVIEWPTADEGTPK